MNNTAWISGGEMQDGLAQFNSDGYQPTMFNSKIKNGAVRVQVGPLPPLDVLEPIWRDLERRSGSSFFLCWDWIGTWVAEIGIQPALLVARRDEVIVGLALIGEDCPRLGPLRVPRIHLNQAGAADFDCVYIEYNDLLVDIKDAEETRSACLATLSECPTAICGLPWQEMRWAASAVAPENMPGHRNLVLEKSKTSLSPYIDLDTVREKESGLYDLLSANTRHQIRRAIRLYEAMGKLSIERASTVKEALAWFDGMRCLHQARRTSRGEPGAFARPFFERFLRRLIQRGFSQGVVDILRVSAGRYELGYLYNFVYRDRVSNYQSGFQFGPDGRHKPGLVAHALAVRHYASSDSRLRKYSFLAGASQYKGSLSTGSEELSWYTYRPSSRLMALKKAIAVIATHLSS